MEVNLQDIKKMSFVLFMLVMLLYFAFAVAHCVQ